MMLWVSSHFDGITGAKPYRIAGTSLLWEGEATTENFVAGYAETAIAGAYASGDRVFLLDLELGEMPSINNFADWTDQDRDDGFAFIADVLAACRAGAPLARVYWYFNHIRPSWTKQLTGDALDAFRWLNAGSPPWSSFDGLCPSVYVEPNVADWVNAADDAALAAGIRTVYQPWLAEIRNFHFNVAPLLWCEFFNALGLVDDYTLIPRSAWQATAQWIGGSFDRAFLFIPSNSPNDEAAQLTDDTAPLLLPGRPKTSFQAKVRSL